MAEQFDATGRYASLYSEAVADLAADVGRGCEGQHLLQRLAAAGEPAGEERGEEANEVAACGYAGVAAGCACHRWIDAADVEHLAVHLEVAVRMGPIHERFPAAGSTVAPSPSGLITRSVTSCCQLRPVACSMTSPRSVYSVFE